jgi:hypothetical protein
MESNAMADLTELMQAQPALAWKVAVGVQGFDPLSPEAKAAAETVRQSDLAQSILSACNPGPRVYKKWDGPHWVVAQLADLGYPPGDPAVRPWMDKVLDAWVDAARQEDHVRLLDGRVRRHASQEGNAIWSSLRLGFADGRTDKLVQNLLGWQWPDGGWNCDPEPKADTSSFMETLLPLRALALYAQVTGDPTVQQAAARAAEVFLCRHLFRRLHGGQIINPHFVLLHYPAYWHYDILFGLKVMAEAGFISDPRCAAALDLLESKRLPSGGFPAEASYSRRGNAGVSGYSPADWGGISRLKPNPFVTADALTVLRSAGRI